MKLTTRQQEAEKIIKAVMAEPGSYGVCEGCGSIVKRGTSVCPACNGYQMNWQAVRVILQAQKLAENPAQSVVKEDMV